MSIKLELTNENYCATVVRISSTVNLDGLDNLVGAPIFGFNALISKDYNLDDLYILFTAESQLSEDYCKYNNLYDHPELNLDQTKKGYINSKRRVRAVRLRGHMSSALLMRLDSLSYLNIDIQNLKEGDTFNSINGIEIVKKYVIKIQHSNNAQQKTRKFKNRSLLDNKLIPEHVDTSHWARNSHKVSDETNIIVSDKLHGSSVRLSNQKTICYPKFIENILVKLYNKGYGNYKLVKFIERFFRKTKWAPIAGSRRVIKLKNSNQIGYYDDDIYNQALDKIAHLIPKSWVIYGELIGWTPNNKPIQPKYTYDVPVGQCHLYVYRIAIVNDDGISCDLSFHQMERWCKENGLNICPKIWEGPKKDFDYTKYMDIKYFESGYTNCIPLSRDSPCDEGVVIRIEGPLIPEFYKAKSPIFLGHETKELDSGNITLEDEQSEEI